MSRWALPRDMSASGSPWRAARRPRPRRSTCPTPRTPRRSEDKEVAAERGEARRAVPACRPTRRASCSRRVLPPAAPPALLRNPRPPAPPPGPRMPLRLPESPLPPPPSELMRLPVPAGDGAGAARLLTRGVAGRAVRQPRSCRKIPSFATGRRSQVASEDVAIAPMLPLMATPLLVPRPARRPHAGRLDRRRPRRGTARPHDAGPVRAADPAGALREPHPADARDARGRGHAADGDAGVWWSKSRPRSKVRTDTSSIDGRVDGVEDPVAARRPRLVPPAAAAGVFDPGRTPSSVGLSR